MKKKAPRNKTISLTGKETAAYAARTVRLTRTAALSEVLDKTICQDALKALDLLPDACADLLIADPPYNLTKIFGKSTFKEMDFDAYKLWLDKWLAKTVRLLKDDASVYICADWKRPLPFPKLPANTLFCKTGFRGSAKRPRRVKQLEKLSGRHLVLYQKPQLQIQSGCG